MFSSTRRSRRQRNPQGPEKKEQPFFSKANDTESQAAGKSSPFFQAKLTVGQPGDQYEKEADSVADKVVNHSNKAAPVQKKGIRGFIQRITLATPQEDEKLSTTEQRMDRDKYVQEKPEVMAMHAPEEEGAVQKQEEEEAVQAKMIQKQEEEEPVQMQEEEEEPVQMQEEEEEAVQAKMIRRQAEEEEPLQKQEEEEEVQAKTEAGGGVAGPQLSNRIKGAAGKGKPLPGQTRAEMESSFGVDFRGVNIHTDQNAVEMNQQLGAQAFTHGKDVYFNAGKFNPENSQGKHLLAHELTHVVQQQGAYLQPSTVSSTAVQRKKRNISAGDSNVIQRAYETKQVVEENQGLIKAKLEEWLAYTERALSDIESKIGNAEGNEKAKLEEANVQLVEAKKLAGVLLGKLAGNFEKYIYVIQDGVIGGIGFSRLHGAKDDETYVEDLMSNPYKFYPMNAKDGQEAAASNRSGPAILLPMVESAFDAGHKKVRLLAGSPNARDFYHYAKFGAFDGKTRALTFDKARLVELTNDKGELNMILPRNRMEESIRTLKPKQK